MTRLANKYVRAFSSIFIVSTILVHAEPSVYGFGSDESESTLDTQSFGNSPSTIPALKQKIAEQEERIDGLTTIIEGLSASINELKLSQNMGSAPMQDSDGSNTALLKKLATMIDEINANYVSKEELQKALGGSKNVKLSTETVSKKEESIEGQSNAQLYSEGVRLFGKQRYEEAKKRFEITDRKGYKPAASNYYLGEISYYTKKYEDAIFYFKKSAGLYDKASYIDTLLLHTAVSLENNGDKGQAKVFYENIIENYPQKKSAKIAKERMKKL